MGWVLLMVMAAGVVPICLDVHSGVREVLEHGVNGLIVRIAPTISFPP